MGYVFGLLGFVSVLLGALCLIGVVMPSFGGRRSVMAPLICGASMLIAGMVLLVIAGSHI